MPSSPSPRSCLTRILCVLSRPSFSMSAPAAVSQVSVPPCPAGEPTATRSDAGCLGNRSPRLPTPPRDHFRPPSVSGSVSSSFRRCLVAAPAGRTAAGLSVASSGARYEGGVAGLRVGWSDRGARVCHPVDSRGSPLTARDVRGVGKVADVRAGTTAERGRASSVRRGGPCSSMAWLTGPDYRSGPRGPVAGCARSPPARHRRSRPATSRPDRFCCDMICAARGSCRTTP